ncbi:DNA repair protein XRCC1 [Morella rubra]|uniref:DNA repair protein XRCC1 n=1 Tax=Morella rubra TaxID=262757 RepID=A0A6A1W033_9ROSI|nr:DNA repair protein XRCC1 [Morella rubra]
MSNTKKSVGAGSDRKTGKRNLPSWTSSREKDEKSIGKKPYRDGDDDGGDEGEKREQANGCGKGRSGTTDFSKLLEGVVFVLSGFVNPDRGILRSQALEMGAEYQPDWNSDCTLLVCAFPNTPKYRQVESDCGTIVSKEWISECYAQKKLVDIESFLMHAGKPWRRSNIPNGSQGQKALPLGKSEKLVERGAHSKSQASNTGKECFQRSKVKRWAVDDLTRTVKWLENQDEKPEQSEIRKIAAEGILTCLQDVIDSLEQKQDIQQVTKQWNFVPHVVEELEKLDGAGTDLASMSKEELCRQAKVCKQIYEEELSNFDDSPPTKKKKPKTGEMNGRTKANTKDATEYDSDETIEMAEEEIELAYRTVASKICQ